MQDLRNLVEMLTVYINNINVENIFPRDAYSIIHIYNVVYCMPCILLKGGVEYVKCHIYRIGSDLNCYDCKSPLIYDLSISGVSNIIRKYKNKEINRQAKYHLLKVLRFLESEEDIDNFKEDILDLAKIISPNLPWRLII